MRPRSASSCRPTKTALCGQRPHTPRRGKEAHQPPPESEYIPFAVIERHIFFGGITVPIFTKGAPFKISFKGEINLKKIYFSLLLSLLLFLTSCGGDDQETQTTSDKDAEDLTPVSFVLDWTPNTNHTGIYVAKANGYFEEQGLDVEIMLSGEVGANQLIASGKADFGVSYQEGLTQARAEGLPLVSIAAVMQHNTAGYASPVEKDITEPKDLEGKIYGGNGYTLEEAMMGSIMKQKDADIDKEEIISMWDADYL